MEAEAKILRNFFEKVSWLNMVISLAHPIIGRFEGDAALVVIMLYSQKREILWQNWTFRMKLISLLPIAVLGSSDDVTCGSVLKLVNKSYGVRLHSHEVLLV